MSPPVKSPSKKFRSTTFTEKLVPVILVVLAVVLVGTLAVLVLSLLGLLPSV